MSAFSMYMDGNAALDVTPEQRRPQPSFTVVPGCVQRPSLPQPAPLHGVQTAGVVILAVAVLVCFAVFGLQVTGNQQRAFETALATTEQTSSRVQPVDSLWSLAQEYPVDGLSSSDTSDLIAAWNSLDDAVLQPGMELLVPAA